MGALHAGHTSLATRSVQENTNTVATVFVNPSQFNKQHDLDTYPKDLDADAIGLHNVGVDYVLAPSAEAMYQDGYRYRISETQVSLPREGEFRPAHFDGVLTVIMKFPSPREAESDLFWRKRLSAIRVGSGYGARVFHGRGRRSVPNRPRT